MEPLLLGLQRLVCRLLRLFVVLESGFQHLLLSRRVANVLNFLILFFQQVEFLAFVVEVCLGLVHISLCHAEIVASLSRRQFLLPHLDEVLLELNVPLDLFLQRLQFLCLLLVSASRLGDLQTQLELLVQFVADLLLAFIGFVQCVLQCLLPLLSLKHPLADHLAKVERCSSNGRRNTRFGDHHPSAAFFTSVAKFFHLARDVAELAAKRLQIR